MILRTAQEDPECMTCSVENVNSQWIKVTLEGSCTDPLVESIFVPGTTFSFRIWINRITREVLLGYDFDAFPAFELYGSFNRGSPNTLCERMPDATDGPLSMYPLIDQISKHDPVLLPLRLIHSVPPEVTVER